MGKFWKNVRNIAKVGSPASWLFDTEGTKEAYRDVTPWDTNYEFEQKQKDKKDAAKSAFEETLADRPTYEIPDELKQYYDTSQSTADEVRGLSQEGLDLAKRQADSGMPGYDIAKSQIGQSTAQALKSIQDAGGGVASLGAITNLYNQQNQALQGLAMNNAQYKSANMQNLQGAYGTAANQLATAGQIQGQGQLAMAGAQDNQFQFNQADPYYDKVNYEMANLGFTQSQLLGQQQARAANQQALIGAGGNILGSVAGAII